MRRKAAAVLIVPALVLAGCHHDSHRAAYSDETAPSNRRAASDSGARGDTLAAHAGAMSDVTPDRRILSILNAKDREEVEIGKLAQSKGDSPEARQFGEMLVRDHGEHAKKVRSVADDAGITLIEPMEVARMMAAEKGRQTPPDPAEKLRGLSGQEFDRVFAAKMAKGHRELIEMVEASRTQRHDSRVASLIDETLPTLKHHEQMAKDLAEKVGAPGRTDVGMTRHENPDHDHPDSGDTNHDDY